MMNKKNIVKIEQCVVLDCLKIIINNCADHENELEEVFNVIIKKYNLGFTFKDIYMMPFDMSEYNSLRNNDNDIDEKAAFDSCLVFLNSGII